MDRFDLIFDDDAEEYMTKKKIKAEELKIAIAKERKAVEEKGVCEFCEWEEGDDPHLRWINGDYICQECFDSNLKEECSHCVPSVIFEETSACIGECEWNELAEEERSK